MLVIAILMILGFGIACIYSSEDLRERTQSSLFAWIMVVLLFLASVGSVLLFYESVSYDVLIKHQKGEITLEPIIHSDTTYTIKRCDN